MSEEAEKEEAAEGEEGAEGEEEEYEEFDRHAVVVEDDGPLNKIISIYLNELGFEVLSYADANKALQTMKIRAAKKEKIDLIISDYMMPAMDGFEFLAEVRKNNFYARTPFLFLSGVKSPAEVEKAKALRANGYLEKPMTLEKLALKLSHFFPDIVEE